MVGPRDDAARAFSLIDVKTEVMIPQANSAVLVHVPPLVIARVIMPLNHMGTFVGPAFNIEHLLSALDANDSIALKLKLLIWSSLETPRHKFAPVRT
jgi:hypothetical protein